MELFPIAQVSDHIAMELFPIAFVPPQRATDELPDEVVLSQSAMDPFFIAFAKVPNANEFCPVAFD